MQPYMFSMSHQRTKERAKKNTSTFTMQSVTTEVSILSLSREQGTSLRHPMGT